MVFYAAFDSISVISRRQFTLFMSFLGFTSTRLGSEVSCPRTLRRKNPDDPVRLEPRTPGLRVKHFTTEPRGTLSERLKKEKILWEKANGSYWVGLNITCITLSSFLKPEYSNFNPDNAGTKLTCFSRQCRSGSDCTEHAV